MREKYGKGEKIMRGGRVMVCGGGEVWEMKKVVCGVMVKKGKCRLYDIELSLEELGVGGCGLGE